jgi:hypothetical protein
VPKDDEAAPAARAAVAPAKGRMTCGACGYALGGRAAQKACPACGAAPEAFRPFEGRLGTKRARTLGLRLHPMAAHAAPAFSATLLALAAGIGAAGEAPLGVVLVDAARVLSVLLPVAILASFLTGLIDGRARLKKGTTPVLVRKMAVSALYLALSFATAALALFTGLDAPALAPFAILAALCSACALYLGRAGAGLRDATVPD